MVVLCFLQNLIVVDGCGMDGWFFLVLMTTPAFCLGCLLSWAGEVFCFFERYLVAKIRTIFLLLVWGGSSLSNVIEVVFHLFLVCF
jgi:hypothetical protein